jgi:hypothetical protein
MDFTSKSLGFLFVGVLLAGCPAEEGEVCYRDDDCTGGLMCCKTSASATARGRCGTVCDLRPDGGPTPDGGPEEDGGTDAGGVDSGPGCTLGDSCGAGRYCDVPGCTGEGTCTMLPTECPPVLAPVCGCDGVTYLSACGASEVGQSVRSDGDCDETDAGPADAGTDAGPTDAGITDGGPDGA